MRRLILFMLALFLLFIMPITIISATCEEGQININSASLEELDKLYGIGPVKAQAIIDSRPFHSLDDLIDVNGIGNATLNGIKAQGLACIEDEDESKEEEDKSKEDITNKTREIDIKADFNTNINLNENKTLELKPISLNFPVNDTKDIKTEENSPILNKNKIALYGFFVFGIVIIILLIIRKKSKIYKNDIE